MLNFLATEYFGVGHVNVNETGFVKKCHFVIIISTATSWPSFEDFV